MARPDGETDNRNQKTKEELDKELDRALKESFPRSDSLSVTQPAPEKPAEEKPAKD